MRPASKKPLLLVCAATLILASGVSRARADLSPRAPKVIYEIFTRSFQDSGTDGIGDLQGIISRLSYLNGSADSLGVDAIWLTPIFPSPSYHGYDVTDYDAVRAEYGTETVFRKLIEQAHRRGIRVLLDLPVNHTSIQHPWFTEDPGLYLWSPEPLDWPDAEGQWYPSDGAYYYSSFDPSMPDLNWKNPEVLSKIESVFKHWVGLGVDGFRLDAAKYLVKGPQGQENTPQTHEIWKKIVHATREAAPKTYFVGEVWDSARNIATYYGNGDELDAAFDFPVMGALRASLDARDGAPLLTAVKKELQTQRSSGFAAPFVGNHDLSRIASEVHDPGLLKLAAVTVLSLPGTPVVYYGDELGIPNGEMARSREDLNQRTPMPWDTSANGGFTPVGVKPWNPLSSNDPALTVQKQIDDPNSLLSAYRALIRLRESDPVLSRGILTDPAAPAPGVVSYIRSLPGTSERILVVLNFSANQPGPLAIPVSGPERAVIRAYGSATGSWEKVEHRNLGKVLVQDLKPGCAALFLLP